MDQRLQRYLFQRQVLYWTVLGIYSLFTIGLICLLYFLLERLSSPTYLYLIALLGPILMAFVYFKILTKNYYTGEYNKGLKLTGDFETTITYLMSPILDRYGFREPIEIIYSGHRGGIETMHTAKNNILYISGNFLMLSDDELQGTLAHEITHLYCRDSYKAVWYVPLSITLTSYLAMVIVTTLITVPIIEAVMISIGLGLFYLQFIFLPKRIMENTADGSATILGYGQGLLTYFKRHVDRRSPFIQSFTEHDHRKVRVDRIEQLMNKLK